MHLIIQVKKNRSIMKVYPKIFYQGICHSCQRGYYYPAGDRFAKPDDKRKLKCVACGYSGNGMIKKDKCAPNS